MHPAFSVLFLTTLIGAGQGLFLALFAIEFFSHFALLPRQSGEFYAQGSLLALGLLVLGLVASFFHLGRPERAWRAIARWRTSWLSREVIVLPAFMGIVFFYGLLHWLNVNPALITLGNDYVVETTGALGLLGVALALALFVCTAMIYAAVKFLQEWHSPLTVINYTVLGTASGFTLATAYAAYGEHFALLPFLGTSAILLTLSGLLTRIASLWRNARLRPRSTVQTAIGIKHPVITQKAQGFMGGSFNTREFFHHRSRGFVQGIRWFFLIGAFVVPSLLLTMSLMMTVNPFTLLSAAFLIQYLGLLAERWFFFAQANHPQNLYYQSMA